MNQYFVAMEPKDRAVPVYVEESKAGTPAICLPNINDANSSASGKRLYHNGVMEERFREHYNYPHSSPFQSHSPSPSPSPSPPLPSIQTLLHQRFQDHRRPHSGHHVKPLGSPTIQYSPTKQRTTLRYHFPQEHPHQPCGDNHMVRVYNHPASASYGETSVPITRSMYASSRSLQPQTTMNQSFSAPWPVASTNTRLVSSSLSPKTIQKVPRKAPTTTVKNVPNKAAARKGAAKASSSSSSPVKTRLAKVTTTASGTKKVLRIGEGSTKYRCKMDGCSKIAHQGGKCIKHGGGKRCEYPDCSKSAQSRNLCFSHGGGRRCKVENCNRGVQRQGLCCIHQDLSDNNKK